MTQPCSITGLKSRYNVSGFNESLILMPAPGSGACASGAAAAGVAVAMASLVAVADAFCLSPNSSISSSHCSALSGASARSLEYPASRSRILSSRAWYAVLTDCMLTSQGVGCQAGNGSLDTCFTFREPPLVPADHVDTLGDVCH